MLMTSRKALTALLAALLLALCFTSAHATYLDVDIGSPTVAGSHTENGSVLTVTGAGTGEKYSGNDQLHYTYQTNTGGDIDIIARISAFSGPAHARAGIMLRTDNNATTTTAATTFAYQDDSSGKHNVFETARDQTLGTGSYNGLTTNITLPIWIRLVRIGKNFAAYRSPDGVIWSMMTNTSGWQFAPTGTIEVGFFAAGGAAGTTCTATFDNITISNTTNMGYKSSWYGNSAGGNLSDGHVSNGISALWTATDGTCYTNSPYDEGGAEAVKEYKDGKVIKSFRDGNEAIGNSSCGEGSITSNGTNVYLVGAGYLGNTLLKTDMQGTAASTKALDLSIDPWDSTRGINIISGLAAANNNSEVYISDSRAQMIRVATTSLPIYYTAGNTKVNITTQIISTAGVPNAAPMIVYQSQRENDYNPYVIPGLTPNTAYTVRCHFAEYTETQTGKRLIDVYAGGQSVIGYDVVAAAGGTFKAAVLDLPNAMTDATGKMNITFSRSSQGGDGHLVICGIEIYSGSTQVFALNCGGVATGSYQAEAYELPSRAFAFTRPGPMVVDTRGDLWIIQEANDFPIGTTMTTKYTGAILCYHPNGTYAGKQITDVTNPAAIAYDSVNDRLLIADNSSNLNIRIYTNLSTAPTFASTFGVQGGLYAGSHPGQINDPANGGYARFYGITGVGVDSQGNIYVANCVQGSDLRKFTAAGALVWMVNGLFFCNCPDVDPDSDGTQAYSTYFHGSLDYNQTAPGAEWSYTGFNWNNSLYGAAPRSGGAQSIMRRVGASRALIHYTSGQGGVGYVGIFRYNGEIIVPCGQIRNDGAQVWIDTNGNGLEDAGEAVNTATGSPGGLAFFNVDLNGDVWLSCLNGTYPVLRHFFFKGLTAQGAPIYGTNVGDYEDIRYPDPGLGVTSTWGQLAKVNYDSDRDIMYLVGPAQNRASDQDDVISYMARYDNWSLGNRTPRWQITLPNPSNDVNFQYETWRPWGCVYEWMGFDVAADKIFIAELWGPIHVYNAANGTLYTILNAGPEISGSDAWDDATMGVTAFKRSNNEFVVFEENSGFDGKANMWRMPGGANVPPAVSITSPNDGMVFGAPATVTITASALDDDGSITKVDFYNGATLLGTDSSKPYSYTWSSISAGAYALTAKATDNSNAVTTSATVNITVLANMPPTVSITSPSNGTAFAAPATITITATAADSDGTVSKIDFYNGGTLLGTSSTSPYSYTWNNVATGSYSLTAKATDNSNNVTTSAMANIVVNTYNTTDLFSGLTVGTVVDSQFGWTRDPLTDGSSGNYGQLQYTNTEGAPVNPPCLKVLACGSSGHQYAYRDLGTNNGLTYWKINADLEFAYVYTGDKRTQVRILIKDAGGNVIANYERLTWNWGGTDYVHFNGQPVIPDCTWPDTTSIDNLCNVWNNMTIEAINGNLKLTYGGNVVTVAPLAGSTLGSPKTLCIMNGENCYYGQYQFVDNLTFTTAASTVNQLPTVGITSPSNYAVYPEPAAFTINATAADADGSITKVDFYQNGTLLGTDSTSPYSYTWSNVVAGVYALTAVATDNAGGTATSPAVNITVQGSLPTTGMLLWLRADALGMNNNDPVATWTDQSGNGRNAVSIGGAAPVFTTNVFNGKPVVRFNGTSLLQVNSLPIGPFTIVTVFKTSNSGELLYEHSDNSISNDGCFLFTSTNSTISIKRGTQTAKDIVCSSPSTWAANRTATIMAVNTFDGTDAGFKLALNGSNQPFNQNYTGNINTTAVTTAHFNIGMRAMYSNLALHGDIAEIVVYDHVLNSSDLTALNNALISKYALDTPPTVSLTAPSNGAVFTAPANITCTATASDSDGTISKVEFYNGITLLGTASTSPYSYAWNGVAAGSYALTALAYDNLGFTTVSATANIIVDTPPTVSITSPVANTNYVAPASVTINATASDSDGTVSKVEFYQGSTLLGTDSTSPYSYSWTSVAMGNYNLTAKAYDNNNVATTSSTVNIIVWGTSDIGSVGVAGSASYSSGTFTVSGAGAGVTSTADAFRFVYRQFSGNTTIVARVASAASATTAERTGVMMRQNLNANSIEASAMYKPTSTYYVYFLRRTSAGGSTSSTSSTAAAVPYWVKVVRSSNTLSAFMSANGSSWTQVGSNTTVTMTDPIYVGLAVTSGSTSAAKTVTFDNVSITQP